ncbi:MAG TPA: kelch repeat-containing protein, partial [Thermoplasmata archaeon]|nr:kelch repeat-containing protein [Thermoplasmata archaeon]
ADAPLVYDDTDGYMLMFGGLGSTGTPVADTWSFLGGTWTHLAPAQAPATDYFASMAFDAQDSTVVYLSGFAHEGTWLY